MQMEHLIALKEDQEQQQKAKIKRMQEAILKVGTLQEKSNQNHQKQCDYIASLLQ
mgnify:CR=1 FL=1